MRCSKCGKILESKAKLCPNCNRLVVASTRHTSAGSPYADVLKPRSTVDVKGLGTKMTGSHDVKAVRHKITSSDESESSRKIRCMKCGSVNDKGDKFCRKCRTRIT